MTIDWNTVLLLSITPVGGLLLAITVFYLTRPRERPEQDD